VPRLASAGQQTRRLTDQYQRAPVGRESAGGAVVGDRRDRERASHEALTEKAPALASHSDLVERLAGRQERSEVLGLSGKAYHLELEGFWDDDAHDGLRAGRWPSVDGGEDLGLRLRLVTWLSSAAGNGAATGIPRGAPRFALTWVVLLVLALAIVMTGVDAVALTEYAVIFSVVALPLTYVPILLVANDPSYMGRYVNGRVANVLGLVYLAVIAVIGLTAIPLMIVTNAGQN
jgi:hypothetical protein